MDFMGLPGQLHNRLIYLLLCLLFSCASSHEKPLTYIDADTIKLNHRNGITLNNNETLHGILYKLYPNGDTMFVKSYCQGKEHGNWRKYFNNGKLKESRNYVFGKKEGVYKAYWREGELKLEYHFKNDLYEGTNRIWLPNGLLIQEMNYKNGKESGTQKAWYDNGQIKSNYIIKDGRRYGLLGTKNCVNVSDTLQAQ